MKTIWNIDPTSFKVDEKKKEVTTSGLPELVGRSGLYAGEGMAIFFSEGFRNKEFYVANTRTGKVRKFVDKMGNVLVDMSAIDMETIRSKCSNGFSNAQRKLTQYANMNRWDGFKNGLCVLTWMLYPDGRYFEDEDGFGGECCNEESIYAIINTSLEIVKPFTCIGDVSEYLKEMRGCK